MALCKGYLQAFSALLLCTSVAYGWGFDGHFITCEIAWLRLSGPAKAHVSNLLQLHDPRDLKNSNDFASLCSWADEIRSHYKWSKALHYINIQDNKCNYLRTRDCMQDQCVAGAIHNYTKQLRRYASGRNSQNNITEALLFLSHFVGDIHQPLPVGHYSDKGGTKIDVNTWYSPKKKISLHYVWDNGIIMTAQRQYCHSDVRALLRTLQTKINTETAWANEAWEACPANMAACPEKYAKEGIKEACSYAYNTPPPAHGSAPRPFLDDSYLLRLYQVIVEKKLAQGGVRLAAILNNIFR